MIKDIRKYKWLVWGILCLAYIISIFHRMGLGVIKIDLEKTFGMSAIIFAALSSAYLYVYLVMQIPVGILVDTLGVRKTASAGILLAGTGSLLFGFSTTTFSVFCGRLLVGMGVSVIYIAILKIQTEWFNESEFATLTGLTTFMGNLGGIMAQTPLVILVSLLTWRYTFGLLGLISIVLAMLCFLYIRNRPSDLNEKIRAKNRTENNANLKVGTIAALSDICRNIKTWPACFIYGTFYGTYLTITGTWGPSYLRDVYGMSEGKAASYVIIVIIGFAAASFLINLVSDKIMLRKLPMIVLGLIYLLLWSVLTFVYGGKPPLAILGIFFFIMGFCATAYEPSVPAVMEVNNPRYSGISLSVINAGGLFWGALIPILFGSVLDRNKNILDARQLYNKGFLVCLACVAIGYIFIFFVKETNCRNIYKNSFANNQHAGDT